MGQRMCYYCRAWIDGNERDAVRHMVDCPPHPLFQVFQNIEMLLALDCDMPAQVAALRERARRDGRISLNDDSPVC